MIFGNLVEILLYFVTAGFSDFLRVMWFFMVVSMWGTQFWGFLVRKWCLVCFRVKSKWHWPYMEMTNCDGRHLGFFPEGLAYDVGSKCQIFFLSLCIVKLDLERMFCYVLGWRQSYSDHIWRCEIWAAAILDFTQRGWPMILCEIFSFPRTVWIVLLALEMMFVDVS